MSAGEIMLILVIYLLFFGAKGLPSVAQSLGKAVYQFKNAANDVQKEIMNSAGEIRKEASLRMDQMDVEGPKPVGATPKQDVKTEDSPNATEKES